MVISPDGARLYTASAGGTLRVWDAVFGDPLGRLVDHGFGINALALSEDASWIAYGTADGGTRVFALRGGDGIYDFTLDRRPILAMAYHPGTNRLAVGDAEGYMMMLDTGDWRSADDLSATLSGPIRALTFSPDGANIHAGRLDNAMYSWPVGGLNAEARMVEAQRNFQTLPEAMSNGERQFQPKCSICHALDPDGGRRAGPTLHRLFGRQSGSVTG